MATIDINQFAGVLPSVEPRQLPPDSAQIAVNVDTRYSDLRPTHAAGTSLTTVAAAAKSVFRTPITGTWLSSATETYYVANQVQDLTQERVYLTGRSAYPEAWENSVYRRLGVPRPTAAPTLTVTENFQFTADDAATFRSETIESWSKAITDNLAESYAGYANTIAGPFNDGAYWLPHGTSTTPALPTNDARMGCYAIPVVVSGSSYKATNEEKHGFAVNPALGGTVVSYSGSNYLAIPMYCRGTVYDFDGAGFKTDAAAILNPQGTAPLADNAALDTIWVPAYTERFSRTVSPRAGTIAELNNLVSEVVRYVNPATGDMLKQAITNFYARTEVADAIDDAADSLANSLYELAVTVWNSQEADSVGARPPSDIYAGYNIP